MNKQLYRKILTICVSAIIAFAFCTSVYANHMSAWTYSTDLPNYGTRVSVKTGSKISAEAIVNFPGCTNDIMPIAEVCLIYSAQSSSKDDYVHLEVNKSISDAYPNIDTIEAKRNITSVSTDDIIVYSGSIVMHTLGLSSASLSDYIYDPDYGDYHYDWVIATSEEIASTSHNKNQCAICEYWH